MPEVRTLSGSVSRPRNSPCAAFLPEALDVYYDRQHAIDTYFKDEETLVVYFDFSPTLQKVYLTYENWALNNDHRNLATHYLVSATK